MSDEPVLENTTFAELKLGQTASLTRTLSPRDVELFGVLSGEATPAPPDEADDSVYRGVVGHGMWTGGLFSALLGTALPGPGTTCLSQQLDFKKPVRPGEKIRVAVTVKHKQDDKPIVVFDCLCTNSLGETVARGTATVLAPVQKIRRSKPPQPDPHAHDRFRELMDCCQQLPRVRTAVIHPVTSATLTAVSEAVQEAFIEPVLVGPQARIRAAADEAGVDISAWELVPTPHSHGAASQAAELAAHGKVAALMKGSLSTDELLAAVVPSAAGLRTERRISHAYVMDVPTYHKLLIITDAAINIAPTLDDKADICRNAIDLWRVMTRDAATPKVAILAATEKVKSGMQATVDAACLCKMADRQQIARAWLDGPLAFDLAISQAAVLEKGLESKVAGDADILLAPDINSANMVSKQLTFLGHAVAAGLVLGAKTPIILTSRADSQRTRLMSCALAVLMTDAKRRRLIK